MSRTLLQWSDLRPTVLRAVGRSGVEYQIQQYVDGRWWLFRFAADGDSGRMVSHGWLADMKALAEANEQDARGPAPTSQPIAWAKAAAGQYRGTASPDRAYLILRVGEVWRLEALTGVDAKHRTPLDEGSLPAMKRRAEQDAAQYLLKEVG